MDKYNIKLLRIRRARTRPVYSWNISWLSELPTTYPCSNIHHCTAASMHSIWRHHISLPLCRMCFLLPSQFSAGKYSEVPPAGLKKITTNTVKLKKKKKIQLKSIMLRKGKERIWRACTFIFKGTSSQPNVEMVPISGEGLIILP